MKPQRPCHRNAEKYVLSLESTFHPGSHVTTDNQEADQGKIRGPEQSCVFENFHSCWCGEIILGLAAADLTLSGCQMMPSTPIPEHNEIPRHPK